MFMDSAVKKQALRLFTYGLYVVTCVDGDEVNAFTVNWLSQVSFEPPLVAVSVENTSKSLSMILRSRRLTINVLRSGEEGRKLAGLLGKSALKSPDKLQGVRFDLLADDTLTLHDALGWVTCEVRQTVEAGDSSLVVAEVINAGMQAEGEPLTMREAGFRHAG
jgi:flavin reductase (DIM6/NTAB) family NADH-FMN oxidoreductase RutF